MQRVSSMDSRLDDARVQPPESETRSIPDGDHAANVVMLDSDASRASPGLGAIRGYRRMGVGLVLCDTLALALTLALSYGLVFGSAVYTGRTIAFFALAATTWILVFQAFSLYAPHRLSSQEQLRRTLSAVSVGTVLLTIMAYRPTGALTRGWVVLTWGLAILLELGLRYAWERVGARLRAGGALTFRTLVVGAGNEASRLATTLSAAGSGFDPIGIAKPGRAPAPDTDLPLVGSTHDLESTIEAHAVDCLFLSVSSLTVDEALRAIQVGRRRGLEVRLATNLPEVLSTRLAVQPVGSTMAVSLRPARLEGTKAIVKRTLDLVVATLALLITAPVWLAIGAAIKVSSPGSVLFIQQRVTKGGRMFNMYKFRTMVENADDLLEQESLDKTVPFFKGAGPDDIRLTPVGRFLRRTSLDELPQLLNVIRGDMSLVGPRPLPAEQVAANLELLQPRHEVAAGVTGWWQINGRSEIEAEDAVRHDLFYIENWSFGLDLYILWRTLGVLVSGKGAY